MDIGINLALFPSTKDKFLKPVLFYLNKLFILQFLTYSYTARQVIVSQVLTMNSGCTKYLKSGGIFRCNNININNINALILEMCFKFLCHFLKANATNPDKFRDVF